jgi:hypothetical protein
MQKKENRDQFLDRLDEFNDTCITVIIMPENYNKGCDRLY